MKILLFEYKQAPNGKIYDFPFKSDTVLLLVAPIAYIQISHEEYPEYTRVRVYGTDRWEGRK